MKVEIRLFASLAKYGKNQLIDKNGFIEVPDSTRIEDIFNKLNIPLGNVKLIFVNGLHASIDQKLKNGDRLGVFPPIGGG